MIPIMQTICDFENGDCFRACVASILELPIEKIPNFMGNGPNFFDENIRKWGDENKIRMIDIQFHDEENRDKSLKDCYIIASGKSPRNNDFMHSIVWFNGKIIHDPHPDKNGIVGNPEIFTLFILKDMKDIRKINS